MAKKMPLDTREKNNEKKEEKRAPRGWAKAHLSPKAQLWVSCQFRQSRERLEKGGGKNWDQGYPQKYVVKFMENH